MTEVSEMRKWQSPDRSNLTSAISAISVISAISAISAISDISALILNPRSDRT